MLDGIRCYILNSICCCLYKKEYRSFKGIQNIEVQQSKKLLGILEKNQNCKYGKRYDFASIKDIAEFQKKVPVTSYEDYEGYIERIKEGEKNVLTSEEVLLLELTSGSTSASKLIPYTNGLKQEFQKGLKPWIYDLYTNFMGMRSGRSYWSITPATTGREYTKGGIPIGFEEDSAYFGKFEKKLMDMVFAVPGDTAKIREMEEFYYTTSLYLLKCKKLKLISVWNPTYLLLLLDYMRENADSLSREIMKEDRKRGIAIRELLRQKDYSRLWKQLRLISCWSDGNAAAYAENLKTIFPGQLIQPKGLLATEGFVSFPFIGEAGARLSLNSHFFEFVSLTDGLIYPAHELKAGMRYSVVITTSGGFYRYMLKDIIEVTGYTGIFPLVRFIGRQDKVSDLFGEKLNEAFVSSVFKKLYTNDHFYMLAPETDRYVLYTDDEASADYLDEELRKSFHYDYCRKLGQLKNLRVFRVNGKPVQQYLEECVRRGQRLGDIKPVALYLKGGWDKVFKGEYL